MIHHIRRLILRYRQARCYHVERTYITRPDSVGLGWYCPTCHKLWDGLEKYQ